MLFELEGYGTLEEFVHGALGTVLTEMLKKTEGADFDEELLTTAAEALIMVSLKDLPKEWVVHLMQQPHNTEIVLLTDDNCFNIDISMELHDIGGTLTRSIAVPVIHPEAN